MDNENKNFDSQTGAPLNDNIAPIEEPIVTTATAPTAKKKSKAPVVAGCVVGGVAVAGIAAACVINFVPSVNNWFKLKTSKPEEYFAKAEKDYFDNNAKKIDEQLSNASDTYASFLDTFSSAKSISDLKMPTFGYNISYGITLDANSLSDITGVVSDVTGSNSLPEGAANVMSVLSSFKSLNLSSDAKSNDNGLVQLKATLGLNDTDIINADIILDTENMGIYVALPSLSETYVKYTLTADQVDTLNKALTQSTSSEEYAQYQKQLKLATKMSENLSKNLGDMLKTYSGIVVDNIKDVKLKQNEKLNVAGEKFSVTEMTSKISNKDATKIVESVLEEAKDDSNIIDIIKDAGVDEKEYKDTIDGMLNSLDSDVTESDKKLTLTAWTDSKGNIIGHSFDFDGSSIGYASIDGNDNTYSSLWLKVSGDKSSDIVCDMVTNGSDKESGTINFSVKSDELDMSEINVKAEYKDYKVIDEKSGLANFDVTISTDVKELKDFTINIKNDSKSVDEASGKIALLYKDKEALGINVGVNKIDDTNINIPSNVIEFTTSDDANALSSKMMQYLQTVNLVTLRDNVEKAINNSAVNTLIDQYFTTFGLDKFNGSQSVSDVATLLQTFTGIKQGSDSDNIIEDSRYYYGDLSDDSFSDYSFSDYSN